MMTLTTVLLVTASVIWVLFGAALYIDLENRWFWFWVEEFGMKSAHRREMPILRSAILLFMACFVGPFMYNAIPFCAEGML